MANLTVLRDVVLTSETSAIQTRTSPRRYFSVVLQGTAAAATDTLDLSSQFSGVSGIVGPRVESSNGITATNDSTWSGTTVTFAATPAGGSYEGEWLVY